MIRLETARLILRDHEPRDLEAYIAIESDPEYRGPQPVHPRQELERGFRDALLVPKPLALWATEVRATGRYIGRCGLYPHRTDAGEIVPNELTLGYYIAREAWGQGFATEAGRALIVEAFERLGARRLHAGVHRMNARSIRVIEKLGFTLIEPTSGSDSPALDFELINPASGGRLKSSHSAR